VRGVHSIKGSVGLLLGHVQGASLVASHPLQLLLRVAHGLESLLDPFRAVSAGPVSEETIQTSLETCDTIRTQLSSLTHHGAAVSVSPALLERLGIRSEAPLGHPPKDGREAAFLNTTSQCVD
jgi:chemotaxis protein histidine kinase CheA